MSWFICALKMPEINVPVIAWDGAEVWMAKWNGENWVHEGKYDKPLTNVIMWTVSSENS